MARNSISFIGGGVPLTLHEMARKQSLQLNELEPPTQDRQDEKDAPVTWLSLPHKDQLFVLGMCRLAEPLSNTCLLPYIYYLIRSLQDPSSTSAGITTSAGIVVGLFAFSKFLTSLPWGYLADRWGRKPVILLGLAASIIANLGFGFAKSMPALVFWRIIAGIGNGNIGVMRTMTAEIVQEKIYQSRAFLLLPMVFNLGTVVGLATGGCLAEPVSSLQFLFGPLGKFNFSHGPKGVPWMVEYPFALPTLFNAVALTITFIIANATLKETIPPTSSARTASNIFLRGKSTVARLLRCVFRTTYRSGYVSLRPSSPLPTTQTFFPPPPPQQHLPPPPSSLRSILSPAVLSTLIAFFLLPLHNATFSYLFPIFLSLPPSALQPPSSYLFFFTGGLALPPSTIGLYLSAFGLLSLALKLAFFPALQARLGTLPTFRLALCAFIPAYALVPFLALLPPASGGVLRPLAVCTVLALQGVARTFAIPASVMLLNDCAPSARVRGTVHGAGNMVGSLAKAVGPVVGGAISGWAEERGCVGGVWWGFLCVVAWVGWWWSWRMSDGEREEDKERNRDEESWDARARVREEAREAEAALDFEGKRGRSFSIKES